jgi:hypothetical protein
LKIEELKMPGHCFIEQSLSSTNYLETEKSTSGQGRSSSKAQAKLEDGAKQNVRRLIGVESQNGDWKLKNPLERDSVVEARRIVQEYFTDKYTCLGLTFPQLFVLAAIAIFITSILIFTLTGITELIASTNAVFWLNIGLFGAVGGSISGLLGLQQAFSSINDIPEKVLNSWVTIAKPIIGFAAAVLIAIFIIGGLVQVADIAVSNS